MSSTLDHNNDSSDNEDIFTRKKTVQQKLFASDDEDNNCNGSSENVALVTGDKNIQNHFCDVTNNSDKSEQRTEGARKKTRIVQRSDSESDEDENKSDVTRDNGLNFELNKYDSEPQNARSEPYKSLFSNKDLYDAESSEEESTVLESATKDNTSGLNSSVAYSEDHVLNNDDSSAVKSIGKKHLNRTAKPERKSKKAASREIEGIHSETQRMVRESRVSLPYHRPKPRSLSEFMQRRVSLSTGAMSLKMSSEELAEMGQKLEERAKEAEKFYQSDSEESDTREADDDDDVSSQPTPSGIDIANDNAACELIAPIVATDNQTSACVVVPKELENTFLNRSPVAKTRSDGIVSTSVPESTQCPSSMNSKVQCRDADFPLQVNCEPEKPQILHTQENSLSFNFKCPKNDDTALQSGNVKMDLSKCIVYDSHVTDSQDLVLHFSNNQTSDFLSDSESMVLRSEPISTSLKLSDTENEEPANKVNYLTPHTISNSPKGSEMQKDAAGEIITASDTRICFDSVDKVDPENVASLCSKTGDKFATERDKSSKFEDVDKLLQEHGENTSGEVLKSVSRVLNFNPPSDSEDESDPIGHDKSSIDSGLQLLALSDKNSIVSSNLKLSVLSDKVNVMPMPPRLSGGPNNLVDLEETASPRGVLELMHRFMKHSVKKKVAPEQTRMELSIVTAEKGADGLEEVKKDTVTVLLAGDEALQEDPALAKPGAKLQRLKQELQQQMAQRREQEWSRRQQEQKMDNEEIADDCGLLDDENEEEEEELSDSTETEEEEEEDIVPLLEKARIPNAFLDDEADVSEDDEVSSDEDEDLESVHCSVDKHKADELTASRLERTKTFDMFQSQDAVDNEVDGQSLFDDSDCGLSVSVIPPYQPGGACTQISEPAMEKERFLPPILTPTILTEITANEGSAVAPRVDPCEEGYRPSQDTLYSQFQPKNSLLELCSSGNGLLNGLLQPMATPSTTQVEKELLGLCSGNFSSQPFTASQDTLSAEDSQDLKLNLSDDSVSQTDLARADTEPLVAPECETNTTKPWQNFAIVSSDEEDISIDAQQRRKKKKVSNKRLDFSDEENSNSEPSDDENDDDDDDDGGPQASPQVIDYDSEENEVVAVEKEQKKEARSRAAKEFFENEAELSESEWGSADEDERDLDTLEWEEGDEEKLNEHQLKEQLGRIHMRQVLDEDQREIRQLQELLLEDGELHSDTGGRERKFRWKNLNSGDDLGLENRGHSDDEGRDDAEEEDEEQWRRMRFEREKFFLEQKAKSVEGSEEVHEDSQLLQLGTSAIKKTSFVQTNQKLAIQNVTKRGSFLARGESALARIAQLTRGASEDSVVGGRKNSRNFVFAVLSPEKKGNNTKEESMKMNKRKSVAATPPIVKKLRLSDGNSRGRCLLDQLGY